MKQQYKNLTLALLFLFTCFASFSQVEMEVQQGPNVDVMVTVGSADVDLSTFEDDLEQAMNLKGIPLGKLRVEAFQRSSISSDQADASDIFNSWGKMNFDGTEPPEHSSYSGDYFSFDSNTNRIIADFVNRHTIRGWGFAMYDPNAMFDPDGNVADGSISATWGLSENPYVHAEVGFIFRMEDKQNFYAYIIDNHTYCGNIQGYAGGDGFPAEAIIKVENGSVSLLALNTNSGTSGTATYGWDGNRADMFNAYYNGQVIDFKIEMSGDNIKVSRRGGGGNAGTDWIESFNFNDSTHAEGSYGFYVHEQSGAYFEDITIEKLELRAFKDVLREPQWRNSALRFNVNLDDIEVADFDDDSDLSEILMRTINEDIHYIGWGTNANQTQFERFITQNNTQGTFINRDAGSWSTWIDDMAQYIYEQYEFETVSTGDYFIAGVSVNMDITPSEMKTNTANASYPSGRWKITHDETHFDNDSGRASWSDLFLEDVPEQYDKTGRYTFTFEELPTTPTVLFFHRKPVASFVYSPDTGLITDTSYDLDGGANNGIAQTEWKWKEVDATATNDWTVGQFNKNSVADGQYLVMLTVQDHQGTWSSPSSIYVEKTGDTADGSDLPIAQFSIQPDELTTYSGAITISYEDNSVDPYGRTLSTQTWTVTKRVYDTDGNPTDTEIYSGATAMTDFSAYNTESADYIISLVVTTDTGVDSLPFYRTLSIIHDQSDPTIESDTASGSIDTDTEIVLTFQDEISGSGFDVQRYALVQDVNPPATDAADWTSWSNSQSKTVSFSSGGSGWYIHAEAKDNAGNTGTATFGPFTIALVTAANDDLALTDEDTTSDPIDVLFNDVYDTNFTPTVTIHTQGSLGTASVDGDNKIVYVPNANANGSDTVIYQLDDNGTVVTATLTMSILAQDDMPVITSPTAAYNVSSATYSGNSFNVSSNISSPYGIVFSDDGYKMFVSTYDREVVSYDLTTAFDPTTASYVTNLNLSHRSQGIAFNADGTKFYHTGNSGAGITEYDLSTAYDLSSASLNQRITPTEGNDYNDLTFNNDGTKMFLLGYSDDTIYEYNLSVAYDISTATHTGNTYPITEDSNPMNLDFNTDGTKLFVISIGGELLEYDLSSAFDLSTINFNSIAYDTDSEEGNPYGLAFNADGSKFFTMGFTSRVHEYNMVPIVEYDENDTAVVSDVEANDGDGGASDDGINYALTVGGDNDLFDIDPATGAVTFKVSPDFETPGDANGDNNYEITVLATDTAGTVSQSIVVQVNDVDDTPPSGYTVAIDQDPINPTNEAAASFTFADAEVGATYNYTFTSDGGGTPVTGTGTIVTATDQITGIDLSGLGDGTVTLSVTLTDVAGNEGDAATDTAEKDTTAPSGYTVAIDQDPINPTNEAAASFTFTDAEVGATYNYTFTSDGGGTPVTGTGTIATATDQITGIDLNGLGDGTVTLSVTLTDVAGNEGSAATDTTTKDTTAPSGYTVIIDQDPVDTSNETAASFTFADAEVGATYNYTFTSDGGGTPITGTGTIATATDQISGIDLSGLVDGTLTLSVTLTDTAGNEGSAATDTSTKETDADDDGFKDDVDNCPAIANAGQIDTDTDGDGDVCDTDDDSDGTLDVDDDFPLDPAEDTDTDGDGTGDNADTDDDNDGTPDGDDDFPLDPAEDTDTDGDGTGDNADTDDDNDGTPDGDDDFPLDPAEDTDTDGDGTGDNADTDDDNDGTPDGDDDFPLDPAEDTDTDGDGTGDNADTDDDNDGTPDGDDDFPLDPAEDTDTDGDGTGDNADTDDDNDGTPDGDDDFPLDPAEDTDTDGDGTGDNADTDDDNDGTPDGDDDFPLDPAEDTDTDGDGTGDNADTDDDNDGTPDGDDDFPLDPAEDTDTDGDGTGDNADTDDDNDGTPDGDDDFPLDPTEDTDTDGDGTGDNADTDDDNDGTPDGDDDFPLDPTEDTDTDGDGTGDNADTDDDNDGTPDGDDDFPLDPAEDTDTDGDGTGDNADTDDDNDGTPDGDDDFPLDPAEDTDTDGDGTGDNADTDDDNDGTPDGDDDFPLDPAEDTDTDGDGTGDNADTDDDNDGTPDGDDDFPLDPAEDTDTDGDGTGDNADTDDDNDGTPDGDDDFPLDPAEDTDTDGDGTGDNADTDDDNDGTPDGDDDFPLDPAEDTDTDGDGTGDNADTDDDNDGTPDGDDDFPLDPAEDTDTDGDGVGDNADDDADNDGVPDDEDAFPHDPTESSDVDGDGIGDNADDDDDNDGNTDTDTDGDGLGDNVDQDDDNDGTMDDDDDFPMDPAEDTDTDGDGTGDNADTDDDNDGYSDEVEEREGTNSKDATSYPFDNDGDGIPDSMDDDDDNDGILDSEDTFPMDSNPLLKPAQAFTPNGDGNNDTWMIPGIENYPNNVVRVYNRWGHEVYATRAYQNDWEGFYKDNREKLPPGSYLYVIDLGDGNAPLEGWIFINY